MPALETIQQSFLSMKFINDTIVNLGTGILVIVASSLICAPHPDAFYLEVPDELRAIFFSVTAVLALANLTGIPKRIVQSHWESPFADSFLPFGSGGAREKRRLAGLVEATAIGLTLMGHAPVRGLGYALLMILYGRSAMVNTQLLNMGRMVVSTGVSLTAGLLLKDEFYTVV